MAVFDLHADIFTDIALRREAGETNVFDRVHYPVLKQGGIHALICVVWVEPEHHHRRLDRFKEIVSYATADLAESKHARICHDLRELKASSSKIQIVLGLEGMGFVAEAVPSLTANEIEATIASLHGTGFRTGILAWNELNEFAGGAGHSSTSTNDGLTAAGEMLVEAMMRYQWLLDVSHLNEKTFWDVHGMGDYPLFASHSNVQALCAHERNLTNEQLKAIAARDGIIGINAYGPFVRGDGATIDDIIDHVEAVIRLTGEKHVALGFDFIDYLRMHPIGRGFAPAIEQLQTAAAVPNFLQRLRERGFSEQAIERLTFSNAIHFIKKHE